MSENKESGGFFWRLWRIFSSSYLDEVQELPTSMVEEFDEEETQVTSPPQQRRMRRPPIAVMLATVLLAWGLYHFNQDIGSALYSVGGNWFWFTVLLTLLATAPVVHGGVRKAIFDRMCLHTVAGGRLAILFSQIVPEEDLRAGRSGVLRKRVERTQQNLLRVLVGTGIEKSVREMCKSITPKVDHQLALRVRLLETRLHFENQARVGMFAESARRAHAAAVEAYKRNEDALVMIVEILDHMTGLYRLIVDNRHNADLRQLDAFIADKKLPQTTVEVTVSDDVQKEVDQLRDRIALYVAAFSDIDKESSANPDPLLKDAEAEVASIGNPEAQMVNAKNQAVQRKEQEAARRNGHLAAGIKIGSIDPSSRR